MDLFADFIDAVLHAGHCGSGPMRILTIFAASLTHLSLNMVHPGSGLANFPGCSARNTAATQRERKNKNVLHLLLYQITFSEELRTPHIPF